LLHSTSPVDDPLASLTACDAALIVEVDLEPLSASETEAMVVEDFISLVP
jgi:hypothetical protein